FVCSAVIAGIGGALYVPQVGIINPNVFQPLFSVEMVVCVALGGRGRLYGAVVGALAVNFIKTWFTSALPEVWLFFLGSLFVLVTLFLPEGLAGIPALWRRFRSGPALRDQTPRDSASVEGGV
ncbi:MAG: hypothetical protein LBR94_03035, partial [Desulfovibrio sp.]|nr:hypothetical protein [Desulfovibrio sp.]